MPHRLRALAANTTKVSVVTAKIAAIESIANITSNAATATSGNVSGDAFAEPQIGKTVEQRAMFISASVRIAGSFQALWASLPAVRRATSTSSS